MVAIAATGAAGRPLPTLLRVMDEAPQWASYASRSERKAYALAAHDAMSFEDQLAFFRQTREMEIAA